MSHQSEHRNRCGAGSRRGPAQPRRGAGQAVVAVALRTPTRIILTTANGLMGASGAISRHTLMAEGWPLMEVAAVVGPVAAGEPPI